MVTLLGCPGADGSPSSASTGGTDSSGVGTDETAADETAALPPRTAATLVDHTMWTIVEADDDPLAEHRPVDVDCGVTGAYVEGLGLEIDTGACNYLSRQQPTLADIRAGDMIEVSAFHETLASIEPGQAHWAITLGSSVLWQKFIVIPASPGVVDATPFDDAIAIDVDIPAGTPIGLHLHNHGYNTWTLLHVDVVPPEAQ
ncbi:MAG: hypothetical protein K0V04_43080 [Deltaproteobacteria bacterium]|nr:hypothetical protein [Deltaproteobacteria bacterium]